MDGYVEWLLEDGDAEPFPQTATDLEFEGENHIFCDGDLFCDGDILCSDDIVCNSLIERVPWSNTLRWQHRLQ